MTSFGLTDQGFLAPRAVDLIEQIRDDYQAETGLVIDWDVDVFLGVITAVVGDRIGDVAELLQAVADSRDPNIATGVQLDAIASIVGVQRRPALFSAVDLTLLGDPGVEILAGAEVEHPNGSIWSTQADVVLDGGGVGEVEARPADTGPIPATATSAWEIVTPVDGWDSVESTDDATLGRDRETDAELRTRREESLQIVGSASVGAIRANVAQVDGVQAAIVIDNDQIDDQTIEGLALRGKSLAVIVHPVLTVAQEEALASEIYRRIPAGIEPIGDESATVTGLDGFGKEIRWFYANEIAVDVVVTVAGVDASDVEAEIEDLVGNYFASLSVGDAVRRLQILGLVADVDGVISAEVALNGLTVDVEPLITEIAILNSVAVED